MPDPHLVSLEDIGRGIETVRTNWFERLKLDLLPNLNGIALIYARDMRENTHVLLKLSFLHRSGGVILMPTTRQQLSFYSTIVRAASLFELAGRFASLWLSLPPKGGPCSTPPFIDRVSYNVHSYGLTTRTHFKK